MSLDDIASGQWVFRFAKQAVNLNPEIDDHLDISVGTYASGEPPPRRPTVFLVTVMALSKNPF